MALAGEPRVTDPWQRKHEAEIRVEVALTYLKADPPVEMSAIVQMLEQAIGFLRPAE